ncbi:hypothetical protein [Halomicrobium urmianum]|uniref:hypothetical protein n=1 Tax=Halomicrobium urmianum TaxID=1586233 RepID=UPI001CD9AA42|nr:hypothetical protein [Halomicrobium urmianum]
MRRRALVRTTAALTVQLLVASALLVGASLVGTGADLPVVVAFAAASVALFAVRDRLPDVGVVVGHDIDRYLADLWTGAAAAAVTALVLLGATPGELQAAGGLVGLAAMANHFLRPFYALAADLVAWIRGSSAA